MPGGSLYLIGHEKDAKMNTRTPISVLGLPIKYEFLLMKNGYEFIEYIEEFLQKSLLPLSSYISEWELIGDIFVEDAIAAYRNGKTWNADESRELLELNDRESRFLNNYRMLNDEGKRIIRKLMLEMRLKEIDDFRRYDS